MQKDLNPGFYDLTTGGVVGEGEDDYINAVREVKEEVGIETNQLEFLKVLKCEEGSVFANVYLLKDFDRAT